MIRLIVSLSIAIFFALAPSAANEELPISGILNPDFASHIALISTLNDAGEEGVFVTTPNNDLVISILRSEIVAISNEQLGGFLLVYDEAGQSLFELPSGEYQMQLSTPNGSINFSYLNQDSAIQSEERLMMEEELLLQESDDSLFQLYLLTTGELCVVIEDAAHELSYRLTFTGIPALDVKEEITAQ